MSLPERIGVEGTSGLTARLIKSLYGLKQAPNIWCEYLASELVKIGLKKALSSEFFFTSSWPEKALHTASRY